MEIGDTALATISARQRWNDTGIDLVAGGTYEMSACGKWTDWTWTCDADGYTSTRWPMRVAERFRRAQFAPWFALMGALDRDRHEAFIVGRQGVVSPATSGRLYCFANDVVAMYWNNTGHIELTVTRTA
jgi:hypothetical protein